MREPRRHRRDPRPVPDEEGPGQEASRSRSTRPSWRPPRAPARRRGRRQRAPPATTRTSRTARLRASDLTTVTAYDDETTELTYTCACGHGETVRLSEYNRGKLVWKVDWPMRWAYEGVHLRAVRCRPLVARLVVRGRRPDRPGDLRRRAADRPDVRVRRHQRHGQDEQLQGRGADPGRRAEDHGGAAAALAVRPPPAQPVVQDRLRPGDPAALRRVGRAGAQGRRRRRPRRPTSPRYARAVGTAAGPAARAPPRPLPYRTLASVVDITTGDEEQTLRILRDLDPGHPLDLAGRDPAPAGPAEAWVTTQVPADAAHPGAHRARHRDCWPRCPTRTARR